jgi:hypothetical protein
MDDFDTSWLDEAMNSSAFVGGDSDLSWLDDFDFNSLAGPDSFDLSWLDDAMNSSAFVGGQDLNWLDDLIGETQFDTSFMDSLGSLDTNVSVEDILNRNKDAFTTGVGLNPSISGDVYDGLNVNKISSVGELNDVAAGGKLSVEDAAKLGRYDLAGTIITPQVLINLAKDAGYDTIESVARNFKLTPIASDVTSPKAAAAADLFGLSSSGYASNIVSPSTIKTVNEANQAVGNIFSPKSGTNTSTNKVTETIKNILGGGDKGSDNAAMLAALLGGLLGLMNKNKGGGGQTVGYQGKPAGAAPLTATRTALPVSGAPGAGGKRFMSDVVYAAEGGLMDIVSGQPNQNVTFMAGGGLPSQREYLAGTRGLRLGDNRNYDQLIGSGYSVKDALRALPSVGDQELARGGLSSLGSYSDGGRMLKGPGDGMSDSIPASIEGKRPARLANDEFVVPADVVSHLGNGSSDAGADVLYDMMAKVRKARTGNPKQGKQINPKKYVPS